MRKFCLYFTALQLSKLQPRPHPQIFQAKQDKSDLCSMSCAHLSIQCAPGIKDMQASASLTWSMRKARMKDTPLVTPSVSQKYARPNACNRKQKVNQ